VPAEAVARTVTGDVSRILRSAGVNITIGPNGRVTVNLGDSADIVRQADPSHRWEH
jgi:hypothetical protein